MSNNAARFLVFTAVLFALGCETATDNSIESARQCTDNAAQFSLSDAATASTMATACEAKLNGVTSPEAYKIIFGDILLEDQLLANIAKAANARKSTTGNVDGLSSMLPLLVPATMNNVSRIRDVAAGTNNPSIVEVAGMIYTAAQLSQIAGGLTSGTMPANVPTIINNCAADPTCTDNIASTFTTMEASACASPYDNTSTDPNNMCNKFKAIQQQAVQSYGPNYTNQDLILAMQTYASQTH